jgi:hypothetical protein
VRRTLALVAVTVVVTVAGLAALVLTFSSSDEGELREAVSAVPGTELADQCAEHRSPPAGFRFNHAPPVSGPHRPLDVRRDAAALSDDALLHALHRGNVVLAYPSARAPDVARAVQEAVGGPFSAELAEAGQAVILARRDDADGLVALAWRHVLRSEDADALQSFAEAHLGRPPAAC